MPTGKRSLHKKEGEVKKGHRQSVDTVPKHIEIRTDLHDQFLKLCHHKFTDFTKRVNFLINEDIEAHKKTNPEFFNLK